MRTQVVEGDPFGRDKPKSILRKPQARPFVETQEPTPELATSVVKQPLHLQEFTQKTGIPLSGPESPFTMQIIEREGSQLVQEEPRKKRLSKYAQERLNAMK